MTEYAKLILAEQTCHTITKTDSQSLKITYSLTDG